MELVLFVLGVIGLGSTWSGIRLIRDALRTPAPPPIPPAQLANPASGERLYEGARAVVARAPLTLARAFAFVLGLCLVLAPWVAAFVIWAVVDGLGAR